MSELNFPPNSHRSKEAASDNEASREKKFETVVKSPVQEKKASKFSKFLDIFFAEDLDTVKRYAVSDVLIPALKKAIADIIKNGTDTMLYGETDRSKKGYNADRVSYRAYYDDPRDDRTRNNRKKAPSSYNNWIFENRGEAEAVLTRMNEIIRRYGIISILDFYDLIGIDGNHTDERYGWTNLDSAYVIRVRDGYSISLPRAMPIDY